jgi:acetate---CoA ligase (ADP-forming) subunit beta
LNSIIEQCLNQNRNVLTELESKKLIADYGINTTSIDLAKTEEEAVELSNKTGYPVVLKISSQDITHKSDAGGVKVGLKDADEVSRAFKEIMSSCTKYAPDAKIEGITVQNMADPALEVIIGVTTDPQFGPVIMFGLGGIWVEVLKDVSFRLIPVSTKDVKKMIREIRGFNILKGYRGQEPANLELLEDMILKISDMVTKNPEIDEMDLNPVFVSKDKAVAVDARIILKKALVSQLK